MKVFIVCSSYSYEQMFLEAGYEITQDLFKADVVCFTGGSDVSPTLYGEIRHPLTHSDEARDLYEVGVYLKAQRLKKVCVGICRGGQFLNVVNGGGLYQHVEGHAIAGTHEAATYLGDKIQVSSTHHQMMIPHEDAELLLHSDLGSLKVVLEEGGFETEKSSTSDAEALYYRNTDTFCYQPHPEFVGVKECRDFFFDCLGKVLKGAI